MEPSPQADDLRRRLIEEWEHPPQDAPAPLIIEEEATPDRPTHLYVIWDDWSDLNQQKRSEIIMDAYEHVRDPAKSLRVTVAMGLTRQEAQRMKITYQ